MKIRIDKTTNDQLNYAVAVAQGWKARIHPELKVQAMIEHRPWWDSYYPTTSQQQCGKLIDDFNIATRPKNKKWIAKNLLKNYQLSCRVNVTRARKPTRRYENASDFIKNYPVMK
jgi:hypothetical protein